jgi:hypothetical protein
MRELAHTSKRVMLSESSLRKAIKSLLLEERMTYEQIKAGSLQGFTQLASAIIEREKISAGGGKRAVNPDTVSNLIGSKADDNLGLISFPTTYTLNQPKQYDNARDLVVDLISITDGRPTQVGDIAFWVAGVVDFYLDNVYPNGVAINLTSDGKLTGQTIKIPPIQFMYFSPLDAFAVKDLTTASASMTSEKVRDYIRTLTSKEFESLEADFMTSIMQIPDEIKAFLSSASKEAVGKVQGVTSDLSLETPSGAVPVSLDFSKIAAASREAVAAGSELASTFLTNAGPLADAADDIAEAIGGGRIFGTDIKNPIDVVQSRSDLRSLANALIDSYDQGLVVLESAPSDEMEADELRFRKDQEAGLFAAVYTAANITSARKIGSTAFKLTLALAGAGLVIKAYRDYKAAVALSTTDDSLFFTNAFGGIARWYRRGRPARAARDVEKAYKKAGAKSPREYRAAAEEARRSVQAEMDRMADTSWGTIFNQAAAARRPILAAALAAIQRDIDAFKLVISPDLKEKIARLVLDADIADAMNEPMAQILNDLDELMIANGFKEGTYDPILTLFNTKYLRGNIRPLTNVVKAADGQAGEFFMSGNPEDAVKKFGDIIDENKSLKEAIDEMAKRIESDELKTLSDDPDFAALTSTIRWGVARELALGAFVSLLFANAFGRGMMAAKASPVGSMVAQSFTRLNLVTDTGQPAVARTSQAYKAALSFDGVLSDEAQNLVDDMSFDWATFRAGGTEQANVKKLVEACKDVLVKAVACDFENTPAAIATLRTANAAL